MKKGFFAIGLFVVVSISGYFYYVEYPEKAKAKLWNERVAEFEETNFQSGDIIFQTSLSSQSKAIQIATKSKYSHCGIIYKDEAGNIFVLEAIQPVSLTPLKDWINRGENRHYVVKRLLNRDQHLTEETLGQMKEKGKSFIGREYDYYFEWSDDKIYCSELVWKIYQSATGLEIGELQLLSDFDLTHPEVRKKLTERYGESIPYDEKVISPASIFESELLKEVFSN